MSLQPRSKTPVRAKSPKPHRKGTAATPITRTSATDSVERPAKSSSKPAYAKSGKPAFAKGGKPGSTNTPSKRLKNNPRSLERAKRFAESRATAPTEGSERREEFRSPAPRTERGEFRSAPRNSKYAPARREERPATRPDTRPTTRRDARIAEVARGDGRPNFEPQKRVKFIPGGKRTTAPTRSAHSGTATPNNRTFNRATTSRSKNTFASHSNSHSPSHSSSGYSEDFGADDTYLVDVEQLSSSEALKHKPNEETTTTFAELG
ncbi:MAG: hypothetical protein WC800_06620, partial [Candidatus Nanopelagicaceae bacterium]